MYVLFSRIHTAKYVEMRARMQVCIYLIENKGDSLSQKLFIFVLYQVRFLCCISLLNLCFMLFPLAL